MKQNAKHTLLFPLLLIGLVVLFFANLFIGSVSIPPETVVRILLGREGEGPLRFIVLESRFPQALTAVMAGAGLTVAGLLLQTAFRNPLAGPSILGITSGAGLGVAIVSLFLGGSITAGGITWGGYAASIVGAFLGSAVIMGMLILMSLRLKSDLMLLIVGIMVGYLSSSLVTLLSYFSTAESVYGYTMWGMGSFSSITLEQLPILGIITIFGLLVALLMAKPLNIILLGDNYSRNLGVSMNRVRNLLLLSTGILTSVITAYCGPISFIGLAVPHIVRLIFRTSDHRIIIPGSILTGGVIGLLCNLMCILPKDSILPLNAITPIIGVPVILYVIFKDRLKKRG